MNKLFLTSALLIGLMGTSIYSPISVAQGLDTYCAKNDAAGYAGMLFIRYKLPGEDNWHLAKSSQITSPFEQCLYARRDSTDVIVELKMLSLRAVIEKKGGMSWNEAHDNSASIHNCHYHQRRNADGSNNRGKHGVHGINFVFTGLATNPQCRSELR